jgi:hypothetical protein
VIRKIFIFAVGIAAGIVGLYLWQNRPQPTPDTSTLKNSLQIVAQKAMETPFFTDSKLQLVIERSRVEQEVDRIKNLASGYGGTAIQGAMGVDGTEVLAQVSSRSVDRFCSQVRDRDQKVSLVSGHDATAPDPGAAMQLVEVSLKFEP